MTLKLNRGEIWLADLNPQIGTEPGKTRPVLIIQSQFLLDAGHPSTLIIPLTTNLIEAAWPLRVRIAKAQKLKRDSDLLIDQIRAVDNSRLIQGPLTSLSDELLGEVENAVKETLDLELKNPDRLP
ncbi:MAG: type II toxin-antitoxin system PemK/MazF family toxin [Candidatus Eremiobacteraeota bacterium]|jgi:mRNA interferase MazF|nr:type II toxin-antitoxin system PemK/MazF family toxin [Candidatus Eremiobacteraeota bacterium]MCL5055345.1 type II toxin-antitoxin system PemK/MazF family toxin [Bacillota bacterium]